MGTRAYRQLISPAEIGYMLSENTAIFEIVALSAEDYLEVIRSGSATGVQGGRIYDALHLAAARKANCDIIYTFNVKHFRELAPDLATKIRAPQLP
jgi:predicted nucleic acid-binding protein